MTGKSRDFKTKVCLSRLLFFRRMASALDPADFQQQGRYGQARANRANGEGYAEKILDRGDKSFIRVDRIGGGQREQSENRFGGEPSRHQGNTACHIQSASGGANVILKHLHRTADRQRARRAARPRDPGGAAPSPRRDRTRPHRTGRRLPSRLPTQRTPRARAAAPHSILTQPVQTILHTASAD